MIISTQESNGKKIELVHRLDGGIDLVLSFPFNPFRRSYIVPIGMMIQDDFGIIVGSDQLPDNVHPEYFIDNLQGFIDNLLNKDC